MCATIAKKVMKEINSNITIDLCQERNTWANPNHSSLLWRGSTRSSVSRVRLGSNWLPCHSSPCTHKKSVFAGRGGVFYELDDTKILMLSGSIAFRKGATMVKCTESMMR